MIFIDSSTLIKKLVNISEYLPFYLLTNLWKCNYNTYFLCYYCSVAHNVFSYVNDFKANPHFLFYQIYCTGFMFKSLILIMLSFIQDDIYGLFGSTWTLPIWQTSFVEDAVLPFKYVILGSLLKQNRVSKVWGPISRSSIHFLWSICLFLCQYHAVYNTMWGWWW